MNILVLGGGGREHALAWAIKQNPKCDRLLVAPGNAGIADIAECADIDIANPGVVVNFCEENTIDFVVIGPEAPLVAGVADRLRDGGVMCFGPSAAAAQLEASKTFTKQICDAVGAPTAAWARFDNAADARSYIARKGLPLVIKADGLAAGKGVVIPETLDIALDVAKSTFSSHGEAGETVLIEEFMEGEEASFFVLCDGETCLPIGTAQDHKRIGDGDTGPNTGGMGAYSPAPVLTQALQDQVMDRIIRPVVAEMARRGTPYQGVLYAGLMIEDGRARLVEFNARFGDPEAQVLMMRLGAQALDLMLACARGTLADTPPPHWADDHALTVVLAARGYPGHYEKGSAIRGADALPEDSRQMLFHAGTARCNGALVANGGRVLNATARGATLAEAQARAYALAAKIDWPEGVYRRDIGWRALA